jgi:hypothetical protein
MGWKGSSVVDAAWRRELSKSIVAGDVHWRMRRRERSMPQGWGWRVGERRERTMRRERIVVEVRSIFEFGG